MTRTLGLAFLLTLTAAVAAAPQPPDAREAARRLNEEGIRLLDAKQYVEAIRVFQTALDRYEDNKNIKTNLATAYAYLGVERLKAGRFADARRALSQAAGLDPESANLLYYRGFLAFKQGQYRESTRLLRSSLARRRDNAAAWKTLGHAYYRLDRLAETLKAWEKALALDPQDAVLRQQRERVRTEAGFKEVVLAGRSRHFRLKIDGSRPDVERVAAQVLAYLEDGYAAVCADLGFYPREVTTVVLYTKRSFQRVTGMHHWVGGTFDGARIRLAIRDFDQHRDAIHRTLVHEFTHMVVHRLAGGSPVPAWINEGLARVEEGVPAAAARDTLRQLGGREALFPLAKLARPFTHLQSLHDARRAYAQSCSFTHYLVTAHTKRGVGRFLRLLRDPPAGGVPAAFEKAFGLALEEAVCRWRATL